jgi:hypothetical protein
MFQHRLVIVALAVVVVLVGATVTASASGGSLVSHWAAEGDATDSSGGNDGTLVGGVGFAPGVIGSAFDLDGLDDHIEVPTDASLDFGTGDFSVEAWVKFTGVPSGSSNLIAERLDVNHGWSMDLQYDRVGGCYAGGPTVSGPPFFSSGSVRGTTQLLDGEFHHITCVRESGVLSLLVDGALEGVPVVAAGDVTLPVDLFIGARRIPSPSGDLFFKGLIDEVKIFGPEIVSTSQGLLDGAAESIGEHSAESKHIGHAIKHLGKALDDRNWIDELHADPKKGKKIFRESASAVKELAKVLKEDEKGKIELSGPARDWIEMALTDIENAIVMLASIRIEESENLIALDPKKQDKVDKENSKAASDFAKATQHVIDGKLDKGLKEFGKAWHHAVKAEEHALK